jgi:hypothetical protein
MNWRKMGLVFSPARTADWLTSHASLPVALPLGESFLRVYFASRDAEHRSHIGYVELDLESPTEVLRVCSEPVLSPGALGFFDDHGVYAASIVQHGGRCYLYYIGWNPGVRPPLFYSSVGLAISDDHGKSFTRASPAPILARSRYDPCLVTSPCVLLDGGVWRMWYVSGFKWEESHGSLHSFYDIKYAQSEDGVVWERQGLTCIAHRARERNIARPCVVRDGQLYRMWYSYNAGDGYRIGYAESGDGLGWERKDDDAGIALSPSGWDSRAMAYPWVFSHGGVRYMLYNGNEFGREGFGLAIQQAEGFRAT